MKEPKGIWLRFGIPAFFSAVQVAYNSHGAEFSFMDAFTGWAGLWLIYYLGLCVPIAIDSVELELPFFNENKLVNGVVRVLSCVIAGVVIGYIPHAI